MIFVKLLMKFLFSLLFNKGEYQVSNKNFNPVRVLVIPLIIVYSVWVTIRLVEYRTVIEINCQSCVEILDRRLNEKNKK